MAIFIFAKHYSLFKLCTVLKRRLGDVGLLSALVWWKQPSQLCFRNRPRRCLYILSLCMRCCNYLLLISGLNWAVVVRFFRIYWARWVMLLEILRFRIGGLKKRKSVFPPYQQWPPPPRWKGPFFYFDTVQQDVQRKYV